MIGVDLTEALALEADLGKIPGRVVPKVVAATERAAHNVKTQMAADADSSGHYQHFAGSISYDPTFHSPTEIGFEIGPDKGKRQGDLGNILYFGTSKNGPVLNLEGPIRAEESKFLAALRAAAGDVL